MVEEKANDRLYKVRIHFKLSQREFAEKIGITQTFYSALELGKKDISKKTAEKVKNEFGISTKWLLNGEGSTGDNIYIIDEKTKIAAIPDIETNKYPDAIKNIRYIDVFRKNSAEFEKSYTYIKEFSDTIEFIRQILEHTFEEPINELIDLAAQENVDIYKIAAFIEKHKDYFETFNYLYSQLQNDKFESLNLNLSPLERIKIVLGKIEMFI